MAIHMELERKLAEFKKVEAVVVFQSGFTANAGTVSCAILTKDDVVISDELNHASIIDGCRLSRAAIKVFPHKDVEAARDIAWTARFTTQAAHYRRRLQHGWRPRAASSSCAQSPKRAGCIMMVDDAHASGVFGKNGRGTVDHFDMHGRVDVQVGTLSKAIGALGGYVAGNRNLIEFPTIAHGRSCSRRRILRPAAACIAAVDVLMEEPEIIDRLWDNTRFFKAGLRAQGFNIGSSDSPITPVIVGDAAAMKLSDRLFQEGASSRRIAFPTVARDKARVRTIVTATTPGRTCSSRWTHLVASEKNWDSYNYFMYVRQCR